MTKKYMNKFLESFRLRLKVFILDLILLSMVVMVGKNDKQLDHVVEIQSPFYSYIFYHKLLCLIVHDQIEIYQN
jgi:hypothetical protein